MQHVEKDILFTRQRHLADKAGFHYDIRLVVGDIAQSFATKKDIPAPGKSLILYKQPIHTAQYALSKKVIIPKGQYGAGVTTLDFVRKATVDTKKDGYLIKTKQGERYLLKAMPSYGDKAYLFFNITGLGQDAKK